MRQFINTVRGLHNKLFLRFYDILIYFYDNSRYELSTLLIRLGQYFATELREAKLSGWSS